MPIYQTLISFEDMFRKLKEPPVIVNRFSSVTEEDREKIKQLVMTKYSSDLLSVLPSCPGGHLKGEHVVGEYCDICNVIVKSTVEEDIEPILWFETPKDLADRGCKLINPRVWIILSNWFSKSGFDILHWLCNTRYHPGVKRPKIMDAVEALGIERGYTYFTQNFDAIIDALLSIKDFRGKKLPTSFGIQMSGPAYESDELRLFLKTYRDCIFSHYLPVPNRSIYVLEKTSVGSYGDDKMWGPIDAVIMMTSIDTDEKKTATFRDKENRTIRAITLLAEFYEDYDRNDLAKKQGLLRKHLYGARTDFGFRAVITSITEPHDYETIYAPWGAGLTAYRPHLESKLHKLGFGQNQALSFIFSHIEKRDTQGPGGTSLLAKLLQELIDESPYKGLPVIIHRNPYLLMGSAQAVYITKFKDDPADHTISMSILIVRACNADT